MRYSDFTVSDFTLEEYFQSWVFNSGDESVGLFWNAWMENHPEKSADIAEARHILLAIRFKNHSLKEVELAKLWSQIHQVDSPPRNISSPKTLYYKIAATVIGIGLVGVLYLFSDKKPYKRFHTAYGETRNFQLPDGSNVVLNANSTLTLVSVWNDENPRELWLDGEAFFSVVHTANDQLFKLHTQEGVTVEVLGTTFNVYNRTNETKVVLNSGQIRLNIPTAQAPERILMKPGEMVKYKEQHYERKSVDPELYTAWTDNKIILNRTSLSEMVNMLKDSYGLQVNVADPVLLEQTVSGSMPLGDPEVLLEQMAKAFLLRITNDGKFIKVEEI